MTLNQAQFEFTRDVALLINFLYLKGYTATFGEARRTKEQQEIYVKTGKSKTMDSRHLIGLAIDLNLFKDGKYLPDTQDYKIAAEFWLKLNPENVAGYFWGWDGNHFERKPPQVPTKKS